MGEIAKGLLGGAWALVVGWILPTFLTLELAALLVAPAVPAEPFRSFVSLNFTDSQLVILFLAAVVGFLLATLQTPLYKVLEGYWGWPRALKTRRIKRHIRIRSAMIAKADAARAEGTRNESHIWARMRYPFDSDEVAATAFGNAMRRFETYAADRYSLDSQTFHYHLGAHAPAYVMQAQDAARVSVDFAVCFTWTSSLSAATSAIFWAVLGQDDRLLVFAAAGVVAAFFAYRLAIVGTDEWAATVRAQVDLGREGLAKALGLRLPESLEDERRMWSYLNLFVRAPYERSRAAGAITYFRSAPAIAEAKGSPPTEGAHPCWRIQWKRLRGAMPIIEKNAKALKQR